MQHFPATIEGADFDLALTAIDYLQDYENARRRTLRSAAFRIGITKENWREVLQTHPDIALWVEKVQDSELHIEEWYASLYIGLRIWVCYLLPLFIMAHLTNNRSWLKNFKLSLSTNQIFWRC